MVEVFTALAIICFTAQQGGKQECHNALIGGDTPRGTFEIQQRLVLDPLYGGDILQFREDHEEVFAIHRVWLGRPWEKRDQRLKSKDVRQRKMTKGCINVAPEVYVKLVDCCSTATLLIR